MIAKCFAGLGITAGIVGLMAFSPLQEAPPDVPSLPIAPEPVPVVIVSSVPAATTTIVAPKADVVTVATGKFSSKQASKPRRASREIRQKTQDIKKAFAELKIALEQTDSTYEKNEIKDRMIELKEVLKSIQEKAPPVSRVSKAKPNSDASELRKRLSSAMRRIAELQEQGRDKEAAVLRADIEQATALAKQVIAKRKSGGVVRARASRSGVVIRAGAAGELRQNLAAVKRKLDELHEQGRDDEASVIRAELEQALAQQSIAKRRADGAVRSRMSRAGGVMRIREADALKEKLAVAKHKIAELHEQGRYEEADALRRRAEQAATRADRAISELWARSQERVLRAMRESPPEPGRPPRAERAPRPRRADRPDPNPSQRRAPRPGRGGGSDSDRQLHEAMNRIEHMMRAAENLEAAGMLEQASGLRDQAKQMEQKIHEQKQRRERNSFRERGSAGGDHNLAREVEELRREVQELREIVHQIHRKVEELSDDWN